MLQKQTLTIPLGLGVNTKTDEKLVEQGTFNLVCENAIFSKVGSVKKRGGYVLMTTNAYSPLNAAGTAPANLATDYSPTCMAVLDKSVFLRNTDGDYLYSHDDSFNVGLKRIPEAKVTSSIIYSPQTTVDNTDLVYDSGENILACALREAELPAFARTDGTCFVIYDIDKKTTVKASRTSYSSGTEMFGFARASFTRISSVSYYYHVYSTWLQELVVDIYNKYGQKYSGTPANISGVLSDGATTAKKGPIGICRKSDDSLSFIIVPTTTAATGRFVVMSGTSRTVNVTFAMTGTGWKSATAKYDTATSKIYFCYITDTGQARQIVFNEDGSVFTADAALSGATGLSTAAYDQDTVNRIFFNDSTNYYSYESSTLKIQNLLTYNVTDKISLGNSALIMVEDNLFQNTYFALGFSSQQRAGETAFARLEPGTGLNRSSPVEQISRVAKISSTLAYVALPRLTDINGDYNTYSVQLTAIEINQDYSSNNRSIIGKNLHFQGGFLTEFDGQQLFENGFHLKAPSFSAVATTAGSLSGTYSYRITLKYIDRNGQVTRSEPSDIVSVAAFTSKIVEMLIPPMSFGIKALRCKVEIWRTLNGGSTFYFLKEVDANMYQNSFVTGAAITDFTADSVISDNEILYTTGDVLANNPAPSCKFITQGTNRLFLGGLEDENEIAYSKKKLFGECANFSDFFRIRIDCSQYNITGGVTALGFMDDKLIIFKKNSIFFIQGDGPLETGQSDTFTVPELISADTGCVDPRSVVLCPIGLMFKGEKGIYVLGRGLDTKYIGAGVEEFNNYNVTSSVHLSKYNQVLFTLKDSGTSNKYSLVYDYFTQQWSVSNGILALDSDVIDGEHIVLDQATKTPAIQSQTVYLDKGSVYSTRVKTPWIKLSGIQDFGRIWTVTILGKYKSAHALTVKIKYNFDESYVETKTVLPLINDAQYQYKVHLVKQKCEAVQFEIYDSAQTGESMELTAITLEVGARSGSIRLPSARKY